MRMEALETSQDRCCQSCIRGLSENPVLSRIYGQRVPNAEYIGAAIECNRKIRDGYGRSACIVNPDCPRVETFTQGCLRHHIRCPKPRCREKPAGAQIVSSRLVVTPPLLSVRPVCEASGPSELPNQASASRRCPARVLTQSASGSLIALYCHQTRPDMCGVG